MPAKKPLPADAILKGLRERGLARYPGAHLKSPWPGHLDLAVNDKTFAYLSVEGEPFGISCKLPRSSSLALALPFCQPTGYGLGKSGWVSAKLGPGDMPDVEMFEAWIEESYRAQAPRKLIAQLDAGVAPTPPGRTPPRKAAPVEKTPPVKKSPPPRPIPPGKAAPVEKAPAARKPAPGKRSPPTKRAR